MLTRKTEITAIGAAIVGATVAAAVQFYVPSREGVRWWLDSQAGVEMTLRALRITGTVVGLLMSWPPWRQGHWLPAVLLWAGANIGLTMVLFTVGPGNLFPIVMGVGAFMTLRAIAYGTLIGVAVRGLVELTFRLISRRSAT